MPTLLFEIGCEELPASACREAAAQLSALVRTRLGREPTALFAGPRRLAFVLEDVPETQADEVVQGPPLRVAYDGAGNPTKAAEAFARKQGVAVADLRRGEERVSVVVAGQPVRLVLGSVLGGIVADLQFGKSMRWPDAPVRFSRPVRWLCAKLDTETIAVELDGIPSGGRSFGHRFSAGPVEIAAAGEYAATLRAAGVEPDAAERRRRIVAGLEAIGGWSDPAGVLEEVLHLVEWPVVLEGAFAERFLALPERVITAAMQAHQRYFPLGGARFAFVANGGDPDLVRAGNERVLEGRLEDATFTFERDVAVGMDGLLERLPAITFAAGAGSMADKAGRLVRLVGLLGGGEASEEAARLSKADQAAELVREFPDLEGAIGAEYARLAGYGAAVCDAIEEQYLPGSASGPLPSTEAGRLLAVAEKVDNLTVAFALGERPSGTRDPFGLRRAAIGLCRIAIASRFPVDVRLLSHACFELLVGQGASVEESPAGEVAEFVAERLEGLLELPVETVRAARGAPEHSLHRVVLLAEALHRLPAAELSAVHTVYTRAERLAGRAAAQAAPELSPELLVEDAEQEVARVLTAVDAEVAEAVEAEDYDRALRSAAGLGSALERFFEEVLVMADDHAVRANRLRLLLDVRDTVGRLGALSLLPL